MSFETIILEAIHERALIWKSDRCKRASIEKELSRPISRHGYGLNGVHEQIDLMIASGKLCEIESFILDPQAIHPAWGEG